MKVGFLITARLRSTRLPRKLLLPLDGDTVIGKVIDRARSVEGMEHVVLCTSHLPADDELEKTAHDRGIACFRGDPDDVLVRLRDACLHFGLDAFVGITGENPLFDPRHCMQARALLADGADLVRFNGLPIGCAAYGVGMHALRTICDVKQEVDTEIWGYLLHRPALFEVRTVEVDPALRLPGVRLTIDYPEDLDLMRAIFARLPGAPALADVVALLRAEPELLRINAHRKQADLPAEAKARLDAFFATEHGRIAELLRRYREQA